MKFYGIAEIAEKLGAQPTTVAQWYKRGHLPAPFEVLKMGPVWTDEILRDARKAAGARLKKALAGEKKYLSTEPLGAGDVPTHPIEEMRAAQREVRDAELEMKRLNARW